jgi:hypothetical protein
MTWWAVGLWPAQIDNVASRKYPGFDALDILPRRIEAVLATMK